MGEEEAEPVVAFRSTQNILTDVEEEQTSPSSCDTSRELSLWVPVRFSEYQITP